MGIALLSFFTAFHFQEGLAGCGDDPDFYVKMAESQVRKALGEAAKGAEPDSFWLSWGAASPQSSFRSRQDVKDAALKAFDAHTLSLEAKPQAYWGLLPSLECVKLWQQAGDAAPRESVALWLKRLRPSVEACYESQSKGDWISIAPNTNHQAAASLLLASQVYASADPSDAAPKRWAERAALCVSRTFSRQLPGGAFSYLRNSGPDPVYYNFDSAFLGRYYQLSGDEGVRKSLERMAGWSKSATRCGWLTAFSSPWWKHFWGTGGPFFGPEIIASVSGDPLTAEVMKLRRSHTGQPYYFSYYSLLAFKPGAKTQPVSDRCEFDLNANGPALRDGSFDVEAPFRPWCESTCGACVSSESAVTSIVNSVALFGVRDAKQGYQGAWSVVADNPFSKSASLVGEGWLASAVSFRPELATCGDVSAEPSPWERIDIWFADKNGCAGALQLRALADVKAQRVSAWCYVSKDFEADGSSALKTPELSVSLEGLAAALEAPDKAGKGPFVFRGDLAKAPVGGLFKKGSQWALKAVIQRAGAGRLSLGQASSEGTLLSVEVLLDGKRRCVLRYDAAKNELSCGLKALSSVKASAAGTL